jgi:hypothetical protein
MPSLLTRRETCCQLGISLRALLLQWRAAAELSQRALALQLGKSLAWVNRCETGGRRMDPLEWLDWARACGVKPEDAARQLAQRR